MSQKLNKNYKESGTEREKLIQVLEDMDSRTSIIPVRNPEQLIFFAVMERHSDKNSPRFIRLEAPTVNNAMFLPLKGEEAIYSQKNNNIGCLRKDSATFRSIQPYFDDIEEVGFYLIVSEERKLLITPSKRMLSSLCRWLHAGTIEPEINPFAYCYLVTSLHKASPFSIIVRTEDADSRCYKGYMCVSSDFQYMPQELVWDMEEALNTVSKNPVSIHYWCVTNEVTKVYFEFPDHSVEIRNEKIHCGLQYQMSSIGNLSFMVQPYVEYANSRILVGKAFRLENRFSEMNFSERFLEIGQKAYGELKRIRKLFQEQVFKRLRQEVRYGKDILWKAMKEEGFKIGKKRAQQALDLCPDESPYIEFLLWIIQSCSMYTENFSEDISQKMELCMGNAWYHTLLDFDKYVEEIKLEKAKLKKENLK